MPPVERLPIERPDEILPHTGTLSLDRAHALGDVLSRFNLRFRIVAYEGANYPDGSARVPKGAVFVTFDTGEIPEKAVWKMVDEIAPLSRVDGKR